MSTRHEISDWTDATRPMRNAVHDALARLREAIEPAPRITQRGMMSPYLITETDDDELHTRIERSLDEVGEVGSA